MLNPLPYEALYALADMVNQFAYPTTFRQVEAVCDGGLSALENAFGILEDCGCAICESGDYPSDWELYEHTVFF